MKISQIISETPIEDITVSDDLWSWDDQAKKALNTPKFISKLYTAFSNTPYKFRLYFMPANKKYDYIYNKNEIWGGHLSDINRDTSRNNEYDIEKNPSEIRIIFWSNWGIDIDISNNEKVFPFPLTPWIVAHRICHTLDEQERNEKLINAFNTFRNYIDTIYNLEDHLTLKSLSRNKITNLNELRIEMLTQFLIRGKILLDYKENDDMKRIENNLNILAKNIFDSAIGEVFVSA
ncbi:MAG: hypothetical protein WC284_12430 [Candidimonas sp.]